MPKVNQRTNSDGTRVWYVRTRDAGNRQTTETFDTEQEASKFAKLVEAIGGPAAIAHHDREDTASDHYMPTLAEWTTEHIRRLTGVEDRTRIDYARLARRSFLVPLGGYRLDTITRADVADWINTEDRAGHAAKTIHNAHALLSAALSTAVLEQHIATNPAHKNRLPRSGEEERREERFLTHAEYEELLAATPTEDAPLMTLLFGTGLRWSEATCLNVGDIHPGTPPTLTVTKAWKYTPGHGTRVGPPKSKKSRRTVMLPVQVVDALDGLLDRPPTYLLFTAQRGGRVHHGNWRERVWVPACQRAGLTDPRPRIHDARHTHASWLIEQGATLEMVQDQLGHESILVTRKVYGHLQPAMRSQLAAMATAAMQRPSITTPGTPEKLLPRSL